MTHATKFTALLDPRNNPSRWTKKRAILTASASVILLANDTRRQRLGIIKREKRVVRLDDAPESIVDYGEGKLNVLCKTVDTYPLDNGVDLMAPPGALTLLVVVHDAMLYLGKRVSAAFAIRRQEQTIILYLYLVV